MIFWSYAAQTSLFTLGFRTSGEWLFPPILGIFSTDTNEILNSLLLSKYPDSFSVLSPLCSPWFWSSGFGFFWNTHSLPRFPCLLVARSSVAFFLKCWPLVPEIWNLGCCFFFFLPLDHSFASLHFLVVCSRPSCPHVPLLHRRVCLWSTCHMITRSLVNELLMVQVCREGLPVHERSLCVQETT